jgi:hypothetical protein
MIGPNNGGPGQTAAYMTYDPNNPQSAQQGAQQPMSPYLYASYQQQQQMMQQQQQQQQMHHHGQQQFQPQYIMSPQQQQPPTSSTPSMIQQNNNSSSNNNNNSNNANNNNNTSNSSAPHTPSPMPNNQPPMVYQGQPGSYQAYMQHSSGAYPPVGPQQQPVHLQHPNAAPPTGPYNPYSIQPFGKLVLTTIN